MIVLKRLKKLLFMTSKLGLGIVLTAVLCLIFLLYTSPGLQLSYVLLKKFLPGDLEIVQLEGQLLGQLELQGLTYHQPDSDINIDRLQLTIKPLPLLWGRVAIQRLAASGITIDIYPQEEITDETQMVKKDFFLPLKFSFLDIHINQFKLNLAPQVQPFIIDEIKLAGHSTYSGINFEQLYVANAIYALSGQGQFDWVAPYSLSVTLDIDTHGQTDWPLSTQLTVQGDIAELQMNAAVTQPLRATIQTQLNHIDQNLSADIQGQWQQFQWPLVGMAEITSQSGQFHVTGSLDDYAFKVKAALMGDKFPEQAIVVAGRGDLQAVDLQQIAFYTLGGEINGEGMFQWGDELGWMVDLAFNQLDPSAYWAGWPGQIEGKLVSTGRYAIDDLETTVHLTDLSGEFNSQPLSGDINVAWVDHGLTIHCGMVQLGDNHVTIQGAVNQDWSLEWLIALDNIHQISPLLSGQLNSQGTIEGTFDLPIISASTQVHQFQFDEFSIDTLENAFDLNFDQNVFSQFTLTAVNLKYQGNKVDDIYVGAEGTLVDHQITAQVQQQDDTFDITLAGQYGDNHWGGEVTNLALVSQLLNNWLLVEETPVEISMDNIQIAPLCLATGKQQVCLQGRYQDQQLWEVGLQLEHLDAQLFNQFLPEEFQIQTELNLDLTLAGQKEVLTAGDLNLYIAPGEVIYFDEFEGNNIHFIGGQLNSRIIDGNLNLDITFHISEDDGIQGQFKLPGYHQLAVPDLEQAIIAQIAIQLEDLAPIFNLIPQLDMAEGQINLETVVQGTITAPEVGGTLMINIPDIRIYAAGLELQAMTLTVETEDSNHLIASGQLNSGEGQLTLNGTITLSPQQIQTHTTLSGENFQAVDLEEYQVIISPQLDIKTTNNQIELNGQVEIPHALIKPTNFTNTVQLPDDVVFTDEEITTQEPLQLHSHINVILGDDVALDVLGLEAKLSGEVIVEDYPDQVTTGNGELVINDGEFSMFGQTLTIERGQILYNGGPIDNPNLNIRATRTINSAPTFNNPLNDTAVSFDRLAFPTTMQSLPSFQTFVVGIEITGPAQDPNIQLFSEPSTLDQADILSMLLLGTSLAQASGQEGSALQNNAGVLLQAASSLNIGGVQGTQILSRIQQTFGLSQLGLESQPVFNPDLNQVTNTTALVLGKALTSRLFVNYSIALFEQTNILRVSYLLTDHWSIQSITDGSNNGIDLLYTIER